MSRWPVAVRVAAGATAVVALASAVLSWDALSWGAGQLGVDSRLTWLYQVAVDGLIVTGTAAAWALRKARHRVRAYTWLMLGGAIVASVIGNGAHAGGQNPLHRIGAAVPAAALAGSLHLLIVLVRHVQPGEPDQALVEKPELSPNLEEKRETEKETAPVSRRLTTRQRARRLVARRPQVTAGQAAKARGVSRSHAGRLLAEVRRPQVVDEVAR